ncbi:MAG: hypothetical protein IPI07_05570 [Flavobacteriales bacterium]|nr:hypothetical protein [Flavobacteriales bacterium]
MVKHNICEFQGELSITNIRRYASTSSGVDEAYADSAVQGQYLVGGTYRFLEDPVQRHSGTLQGTFVSTSTSMRREGSDMMTLKTLLTVIATTNS